MQWTATALDEFTIAVETGDGDAFATFEIDRRSSEVRADGAVDEGIGARASRSVDQYCLAWKMAAEVVNDPDRVVGELDLPSEAIVDRMRQLIGVGVIEGAFGLFVAMIEQKACVATRPTPKPAPTSSS